MLFEVIAAGEQFERVVETTPPEAWEGPSLLPGWSRAHVVAHVVLNAEGFVAAAAALRSDGSGFMYRDGVVVREAAIIDLATMSSRAPDSLLRRLHAANGAFVEAWDPAPPIGTCLTAPGSPPFSSATVPSRRFRELQVHLVDLGLPGVGSEQWLEAFVGSDLRLQWPTVAHRTTEPVHVVDEHGATWAAGSPSASSRPLLLARRELLAWVLDRFQPATLPTLEPWSNRSKWEFLETHTPVTP